MPRLRNHIDKQGTLDATQTPLHPCVITAGDDLDLVDTTTGCVIYSTPFTPRGLERLAAYARVHGVWLIPDAPRAAYYLLEGDTRAIAGLQEYVDWFGAAHERDCPGDDTCSCRCKPLNSAVNTLLRRLTPSC